MVINGTAIKEKREELGLSQRVFAAMITDTLGKGFTPAALAGLENEEWDCSVEKLVVICNLLSLKIDDVIKRESINA